jgi:hypothetical protein
MRPETARSLADGGTHLRRRPTETGSASRKSGSGMACFAAGNRTPRANPKQEPVQVQENELKNKSFS